MSSRYARWATLSLLGLCFAASSVSAATEDNDKSVQKAVKVTNKGLKEINSSHCRTCDVAGNSASVSQTRCKQFYEKLFENPSLNVTVSFGYADYPDTPSGNWSDSMYADFIEAMTLPCDKGSSDVACGFKMSADDLTLFTKSIQFERKSKLIQLHVVKGSTSAPIHGDAQTHQSESAENTFLESLANRGITAYASHSRDGGGPDFFPARRNKKGLIDYPWYRSHRPGAKKMDAALDRGGSNRADVIMLYSCETDQHFLADLKKHAPTSTYFLTHRLVDGIEMPDMIQNTLNGLFQFQCRSDIMDSILNDSVRTYHFN